MSKFYVKADAGKNRLGFTLAGTIHKKGLGELYTELRFCVPELRPDFEVIADLSGCTLAFLNIIPTFKNIMNFLLSNNVGEMVGIMPADALIYKQIQLATVFQGYKPSFVSSFAEAEKRLATINRRAALRFFLHDQLVQYSANAQQYDALIHDISVCGCVIKTPAPTVTVGEKVNLCIPLFQLENGQDLSKIEAEVVRVDTDMFAVKFMCFTKEEEKLLWGSLVKVSQQEVPSLCKK